MAQSELGGLYLTDETAWLDETIRLLGAGRYDDLDYASLMEFLESMSGSDRDAVWSKLEVLIVHLLKWEHQPERRSGNWRATIFAHQGQLRRKLARGALRRYALENLPEIYQEGRRLTAEVIGKPREILPAECPWTLDTLLAIEPPLQEDPHG